jgi:hypothetical protein
MRQERGVTAQVPVLEKPFTLARLSRAVRSVLDAPRDHGVLRSR